VLLKINVPIFQGGQTSGETDEARSIYRQSILQAQQLARQVQTDVMKAHTTLKTSVGKSDNLGRAYDKARSSYQGLVSEYRLGLVNNLEVLQAQNVMQQTKHDYDRAVLDSKLNALTLNVVLGEPL
jgi:outer membrane protein